MKRWSTAAFALAVLACVLMASCRKGPERRYELKGKVISVDHKEKQVTLAHEKIPGFMDAMTMPFSVGEDWAMSVLVPGQTVEAELVVQEDRSWIESIRISKSEPSMVRAPGVVPAREGAEVPDFALTNQDNQRIHLHQYRGRPLIVNFIYTRCPLPDYCPRSSKNFSDIYRAVQGKPQSTGKPRLLTVSFDMKNDTPPVLKAYGARYMQPPRYDEWIFATGSPDEIKSITGYFGLAYWPDGDQISHSLVTALIGADGKLQRVYTGNQWKPDEVLSQLR